MIPAEESVSRPAGSRRFLLLAAVLLGAWLAWQVTALPAHLFNATRFILYDPGSYLYAMDCWLGGQHLYRDFAWQYGPLALGWSTGFAAVLGNTPGTLVLACSVAFAGGWLLITRLVVQVAGQRWGGALALLGLLPLMGLSGPYAFNGPHGAIELLVFGVIGSVLASKGKGRAWQLGLLAGGLQWIRFGPHAVALAVIVALEVRRVWPDKRALVRSLASVAAGYLLALAPLAAWFFAALPPAGALEQFWPSHMVGHYAETYRDRWPQFTWEGAAMSWLPAVLGVGLALVAFLPRRRPVAATPKATPDAVAGVLFFPLYYLAGGVLLFRNEYTLMGHLWLAWPGLALVVTLPGRRMRLACLVALVPAFWAPVHGAVAAYRAEQGWHSEKLALPNGQELWFGPNERRNFALLQAVLATQPPPRRLAVFIGGGGVHHFFQTQRVGRHWWYLPGFIRPWEEEVAERALWQHDLIFVADLSSATSPPGAPGVVALWLPLSPAMQERLLPHLRDPRRVGTLGTVVRVEP